MLFFPVCTCICIHLFEKRQDLTVQCTYVTCLNLARIFSSLANISSFVGSLIGKLRSISLTVSNNLTHLRENSNQVSMVYNDDSLSKIRQQDIKIYLWKYRYNGILKCARLLPDQEEKFFWVRIQNTEELQYIHRSITTDS